MNSPSSFKTFPWDSVKQESEAETVALYIVTILARNGNEWRQLGWSEYETERRKDSNFSMKEERYFNEVVMYTESEQTARLFSPTWRDVAAI